MKFSNDKENIEKNYRLDIFGGRIIMNTYTKIMVKHLYQTQKLGQLTTKGPRLTQIAESTSR